MIQVSKHSLFNQSWNNKYRKLNLKFYTNNFMDKQAKHPIDNRILFMMLKVIFFFSNERLNAQF